MQTLFSNGIFYTGPGARAYAVLAGDDGLITEVFSHAPDPLLVRSPHVRHADLNGGFVFPAFEDAHNHPAARARTWYEIDFRKKEAVWEDAARAIRDKAATAPPDRWIVCHGWSATRWPGITQDTLDRLSQNHGILLAHISYHGGLVNKKGVSLLRERSLALRSLDDSGKITERDFEEAMIATSGTREQYISAIPQALAALLRQGITATHDMHVSTIEQMEAYAELARAGALPIDVALYLNPRLFDDPRLKDHLRRQYPGLAIAGVKLFLDGAIGTSTAAVARPYRDGTGSGALRMDTAECAGIIKKAAALGLRHIAMHCIGERAVARAADIFERLQNEYRRDISAWRFEHFEMPDEHAIRTLAERGGIASMQPNFNWDVAHYRARLGEDAERLNPFRHIADAGVALAFGSDDMPSGPATGIRWATCEAPSPHQQLTHDEAIRAYTQIPAAIIGAGQRRGKIATGYEANFAVFAKDPFTTASDDKDMEPREVWRRGVKRI